MKRSANKAGLCLASKERVGKAPKLLGRTLVIQHAPISVGYESVFTFPVTEEDQGYLEREGEEVCTPVVLREFDEDGASYAGSAVYEESEDEGKDGGIDLVLKRKHCDVLTRQLAELPLGVSSKDLRRVIRAVKVACHPDKISLKMDKTGEKSGYGGADPEEKFLCAQWHINERRKLAGLSYNVVDKPINCSTYYPRGQEEEKEEEEDEEDMDTGDEQEQREQRDTQAVCEALADEQRVRSAIISQAVRNSVEAEALAARQALILRRLLEGGMDTDEENTDDDEVMNDDDTDEENIIDDITADQQMDQPLFQEEVSDMESEEGDAEMVEDGGFFITEEEQQYLEGDEQREEVGEEDEEMTSEDGGFFITEEEQQYLEGDEQREEVGEEDEEMTDDVQQVEEEETTDDVQQAVDVSIGNQALLESALKRRHCDVLIRQLAELPLDVTDEELKGVIRAVKIACHPDKVNAGGADPEGKFLCAQWHINERRKLAGLSYYDDIDKPINCPIFLPKGQEEEKEKEEEEEEDELMFDPVRFYVDTQENMQENDSCLADELSVSYKTGRDPSLELYDEVSYQPGRGIGGNTVFLWGVQNTNIDELDVLPSCHETDFETSGWPCKSEDTGTVGQGNEEGKEEGKEEEDDTDGSDASGDGFEEEEGEDDPSVVLKMMEYVDTLEDLEGDTDINSYVSRLVDEEGSDERGDLEGCVPQDTGDDEDENEDIQSEEKDEEEEGEEEGKEEGDTQRDGEYRAVDIFDYIPPLIQDKPEAECMEKCRRLQEYMREQGCAGVLQCRKRPRPRQVNEGGVKCYAKAIARCG